MGISRQEYWSGLPLPSTIFIYILFHFKNSTWIHDNIISLDIISYIFSLKIKICRNTFFYWNTIALDCCVSFHCVTWISHMYKYSLNLESPSHLHPPFEATTELRAEFPVLCSSFLLAIYFTHGSVYMSVLLAVPHASAFPHRIHKSILYVCTSIPALQIIFLNVESWKFKLSKLI